MDEQSPFGSIRSLSGGRRWVWKFLGFALVAVAVLVALRLPPVKRAVFDVLRWTKDLGYGGPPIYVGLFVLAAVCLISGTLMMGAAGFVFGWAAGFGTATVGSVLGACAVFGLGRTLLRGWVERKMAGHPLMLAVDRVVSQKPFRMVFLMRLTPVPTVLLNYVWAVTRVRFWPYVLGTLLGNMPRTLMYTYLGSTAMKAAEILEGKIHATPITYIHLGLGSVFAIVVAVLVSRMAHKALTDPTAPAGNASGSGGTSSSTTTWP
jgi:uncharacterized membrane protein YdjX (TVP38/TMEM64 family)